MSAFLGPIHHWLFGKICVVESRAFAIAEAISGKGVNTEELIANYGEKLEGADLPSLVGGSPIHQFLYGLITKVQVLEAQVVEAAGEDNFETVIKAAEAHGAIIAENAVEKQGAKPENNEAIYEFIHNYQLEGMPCDPAGAANPTSETDLEYTHTVCNHIANWEYTGATPAQMCKVTNAWLKGFVGGTQRIRRISGGKNNSRWRRELSWTNHLKSYRRC